MDRIKNKELKCFVCIIIFLIVFIVSIICTKVVNFSINTTTKCSNICGHNKYYNNFTNNSSNNSVINKNTSNVSMDNLPPPVIKTNLCEPWKLERSGDVPVAVVFKNSTFPGKYTSLFWKWPAVNITGHWVTSLWVSHISGSHSGSMAYRNEYNKAIINLSWRLENGNNLTWVTKTSPDVDIKMIAADMGWTVCVYHTSSWSFESNSDGTDWTFNIDGVTLDGLDGQILLKDKDEPMNETINQMAVFSLESYAVRTLRQKLGNIIFEHLTDEVTEVPKVSRASSAWEMIRHILERIFGRGQTEKRESWFSRIINLLRRPLNRKSTDTNTRTDHRDITTLPPTEVEVFNPDTLNDNDWFYIYNKNKWNSIYNKNLLKFKF